MNGKFYLRYEKQADEDDVEDEAEDDVPPLLLRSVKQALGQRRDVYYADKTLLEMTKWRSAKPGQHSVKYIDQTAPLFFITTEGHGDQEVVTSVFIYDTEFTVGEDIKEAVEEFLEGWAVSYMEDVQPEEFGSLIRWHTLNMPRATVAESFVHIARTHPELLKKLEDDFKLYVEERRGDDEPVDYSQHGFWPCFHADRLLGEGNMTGIRERYTRWLDGSIEKLHALIRSLPRGRELHFERRDLESVAWQKVGDGLPVRATPVMWVNLRQHPDGLRILVRVVYHEETAGLLKNRQVQYHDDFDGLWTNMPLDFKWEYRQALITLYEKLGGHVVLSASYQTSEDQAS